MGKIYYKPAETEKSHQVCVSFKTHAHVHTDTVMGTQEEMLNI